MSRLLSYMALAALVAIVSLGCTSESPATPDASAGTVAKLCGSCGEAKGSESCCSDSAEKCHCGMNKGSELCCLKLGADVTGKDMCADCGHVAESEDCCAEGAETCECGLAKGSPLCCKLKKDDA